MIVLIPFVMYSILNPFPATEKSEMKFNHRYSEDDVNGAGMSLPQYVPITGEVGELPFRTCQMNRHGHAYNGLNSLSFSKRRGLNPIFGVVSFLSALHSPLRKTTLMVFNLHRSLH